MPSSMPLDFDDLTRELDLWEEAGRVAAFWWRDDDAIAPTAALAKLLDLSAAFKIEVAVAVIPALAEDALGEALRPRRRIAIFQHGYAHENHARAGEPAVECGGNRPVDEVLEEFRTGFRRLRQLFGGRFISVLAAPWNRIERPVLERLPEAGFRGASAYGRRAAMNGVPGLVVANAHVDPLNWRERRFAGLDKALSAMLGELTARRSGAADPDEPLGLLTHHLVHDAELWGFLERFFSVTCAHPAAHWLRISEAFPAQQAKTAPLRAAR